MVFKKPYGFLIKHFKLIHLILTGLYIYLAIKVGNILSYYNKFIVGSVGKLEAIDYVTNYYVIAIILSIGICAVVYALLRYKKKPRTLYIGLIVFSIIVAWIIQYAYGGLETIYLSVLDVKTMRLIRDILKILVVFQYIGIGIVLVRGLGFDIKKFNFVKDLQELDIDVSDEEEVELTFGSTNKLERKINRKIREFKYYYLENKVFIHVILAIVLVFGLSSWILNREVINKEYQQGEVFATEEFRFQALSTFVTAKSDDNRVILDDDKVFAIVKMNVWSNNGKKKLNTSNLILEVNYNSYASDGYYGARFTDLGIAYNGQQIGGGVTYLFIYKINKEDIGKKMRIVYAGDKVINLKPMLLDEEEKYSNYKLNQNIDFSNSILGGGHFKVLSSLVADKFSYPYQYEIDGKTYTNHYTLSSTRGALINLKIDSDYPKGLDDYKFLNKYAKIKYKIKDKEYVVEHFDNKTPGNYKEGLYLAVNKEVLEASEIWLDIKVRNKQYKYVIK